MFNKQLKANIKKLDLQIGKLSDELIIITDETKYEMQLQKIEDLTKIRGQLTESKVKDSHAGVIISGLFSIGGMLIVLDYEKDHVVTSKVFGMATKMFRGV